MTPFVLHKEAMKRDAVLNLRLPADVKEAVRKAAEDDFGRSSSSMVVRILREWLAQKGYLAKADEAPKARRKR